VQRHRQVGSQIAAPEQVEQHRKHAERVTDLLGAGRPRAARAGRPVHRAPPVPAGAFTLALRLDQLTDQQLASLTDLANHHDPLTVAQTEDMILSLNRTSDQGSRTDGLEARVPIVDASGHLAAAARTLIWRAPGHLPGAQQQRPALIAPEGPPSAEQVGA
jgi:hypothetical protein